MQSPWLAQGVLVGAYMHWLPLQQGTHPVDPAVQGWLAAGVAPGMQHPGPLFAVPALALTEPELGALPAKPVLLNEQPQLPAPPAPQQPAGFGGAVPTFPELQLALSPPLSGYGLGQLPPLVLHKPNGVQS